jgi:hypothetical protein
MQTSKINLIAAEVAKTLASPELATKGNITMLTLKLEKWHEEVPRALQIPTLLSSDAQDLTLFQRRAVFMVHVSKSSVVVQHRHTDSIRSCIWVRWSCYIANC